MSKIVIAGIIIAVAIGVGVAAASISMDSTEINEEPIQSEDVVLDEQVLDEILPVEESEPTGRDISVELTESIGLKTP